MRVRVLACALVAALGLSALGCGDGGGGAAPKAPEGSPQLKVQTPGGVGGPKAPKPQ